MRRLLLIAVAAIVLALPGVGQAGNYPRDWLPAPDGTDAFLLYYQNTTANKLMADNEEAAEVDFDMTVMIARYAHYWTLFDCPTMTNVILPFADAEMAVGGAQTEGTGFGDPALIQAFWPLADQENLRWAGIAQYIYFPIGDYDRIGVGNPVAENRWKFHTEANFTQGFEITPGHNLYVELTPSVDFFTDNDDYGAAGVTMEQDPVYRFETHVSYDINTSLLVSADYYGEWGGEKEYGGTTDDAVNTHTLGATIGFMITPQTQLMCSYQKDLYVEEGVKKRSFLVRLAYFF